MRAFLAVFGREVVERRLLAIGAFVLGLVPLVTPWLPGLEQRGGPEVRSATALALALCFSFGLAVILGSSIVGRDLAEGRLAFYFARPIRGWAVWAGKLGAATVLALGAGALILLPAAAWERRLEIGDWWAIRGTLVGTSASLLTWVGAILLLVLLSHAAGVALRSRSPWLTLDFAGLGLVAWLSWSAVRRVISAGAVGPSVVAAGGLLAGILLALIAAGVAQVLGGRTDIRRGHRLLSLTLWGALLAAGLVAQGYTFWVLAAEPEDLGKVYLTGVAAHGPWIAITGPARHRVEYYPEFLLDTSSGRFARLKAGSDWNPPKFSADGRWAVWLEPQGNVLRGAGPYELLRLDMSDPRSRPERTGMTYSGAMPQLAVSPDGGRVAVGIGRRLTIEEVPSGRLLASADLVREIDRYDDSLLFIDPERVRMFGYEMFSSTDAGLELGALEVGEMKVSGGGVVRTARIEEVVDPRMSVDGTRLLARRRTDQRVIVVDTRSGAVMAELPPAGERSRASFLADGRIALVSGEEEKALQIFSPAFVPERIFHFKTAKTLRLGGQPAPDRLIVAAAPRGPATSRWDIGSTMVLDLATGSVRRLGHGLLPAAGPHWGPESAAPRLFMAGGDRLVRVDLATGRQTVIAGRPAD